MRVTLNRLSFTWAITRTILNRRIEAALRLPIRMCCNLCDVNWIWWVLAATQQSQMAPKMICSTCRSKHRVSFKDRSLRRVTRVNWTKMMKPQIQLSIVFWRAEIFKCQLHSSTSKAIKWWVAMPSGKTIISWGIASLKERERAVSSASSKRQTV